jgi:type I restriction enzyme S subunit
VIKNRASGTTFQEISKRNFRPIPALVPSPDVLKQFVIIVEPIYKQIVRNLEESRTLAETRDALLPRLVSGELRVGELEDIP